MTFFLFFPVLILCIFTITAVSCVSSPTVTKAGTIFLTDSKFVSLLPLESIEQSFELHQVIEGYYNSESYYIEAFVTVSKKSLSVTALSNFGVQAYDLVYENSEVCFESAYMTAGVRPEYMVADFQLCYFPAALVKEMIQKAGLGFEEEINEAGFTRRILDGNNLIIEIKREYQTLIFRNMLRNYGYTIQESSIN